MNILPLCLVFPNVLLTSSMTATLLSESQTTPYNPGEECLPYDGSEVPNCSDFIDGETKWAFYHPHSSNCSRFWECGPHVETCLFECAGCQNSIGENPACNNQWALTFKPDLQYPDGPTCIWPVDDGCSNGLRCNVTSPDNTDCNLGELCGTCVAPGYCEYHRCCKTDGDCTLKCNGQCEPDGQCSYPDCCEDSECDHVDGECNVPAPHDGNFCDYCKDGNCEPGCSQGGLDSINCPSTHPTCLDHVCGCTNNAECDNYDGMCDMSDVSDHYDGHCYYCNGAKAECIPGCGGLGLNNNYNCPVNYECNLGTHKCEEMVCSDDKMCVGFDQVCNEPNDTCFYCGNCADDGCCPGCHDTILNCKQGDFCNLDTHQCEQMVCNDDKMCDGFDQVCNEANDNCFYCANCADDGCCPGCHNTLINCKPGDVCNMDTHICEPICEEDEDCNLQPVSGVCDSGHTDYTECFYCSKNASTGNTCEPGCIHNSGSNEVPRCPDLIPTCNLETHKCEANTGNTLLNYIKVKSKGCDGCQEEGISLILVGIKQATNQPECETSILDHPGIIDYASVGEFNAIPEEQDDGWGACYRYPLDGQITNATLTWRGSGNWRGENVCFDWNDSNKFAFICDLPAGSSLSNGTSSNLICRTADGADCP